MFRFCVARGTNFPNQVVKRLCPGGYLNHEMQRCRYRFSSKCSKCDKWHMSFLCDYYSPRESRSVLDPVVESSKKSAGERYPADNRKLKESGSKPENKEKFEKGPKIRMQNLLAL